MRRFAPMTRFLAAAALALAAPVLAGNQHPSQNGSSTRADAQLERALTTLRLNGIDSALAEVDSILARYPNFRLAYLVRGDLLLARARPISGFGNTKHVNGERLDELRTEALKRLRARDVHPSDGIVPRYLLRAAPQTKNAIVIDTGLSRVYVYENANGGWRLADDYYTTIGKYGIAKEREGDKKTPIGVYRVISHIPGKRLPDLYGWGAFPIDYPNEWDRMRGRTGYGIWLHGVPSDTYARPPQASDGCVALANPDIAELSKRVQTGETPVIIADRIEWVPAQKLRNERDAFLEALEAWRGDWESRDAERYLAHYATGFRSSDMDRAAWGAHKRRVNGAKRWIKVALNGLSAFRYPGAGDMMSVSFEQDYRSNNLSQRTRKRQYWVLESGRWKIAYEGPVTGRAIALPESYRGAR
ncbi:MAG: L,D-transpeptidase family protein [Pseudomonadota bacterium]